jgi:DNA-directed RNA polymerase specialized sigma24 family protein
VVQRAWEIVLPKLFPRTLLPHAGDEQVLREREGRLGPVLRGYLATTVLRIVNGVSRQRIRERLQPEGVHMSSWPAATSDALAKALRAEGTERLLSCIRALDPVDQGILVMAGVEGLPREEIALHVARETGEPPMTQGAVRVRLHRVRERVRKCLGDDTSILTGLQ